MIGSLVIEIERRCLRSFDKLFLIGDQLFVADLRHCGHEHPLLRILGIMYLVFLKRFVVSLHNSSGMAETCHQTCQHRYAETL